MIRVLRAVYEYEVPQYSLERTAAYPVANIMTSRSIFSPVKGVDIVNMQVLNRSHEHTCLCHYSITSNDFDSVIVKLNIGEVQGLQIPEIKYNAFASQSCKWILVRSDFSYTDDEK